MLRRHHPSLHVSPESRPTAAPKFYESKRKLSAYIADRQYLQLSVLNGAVTGTSECASVGPPLGTERV